MQGLLWNTIMSEKGEARRIASCGLERVYVQTGKTPVIQWFSGGTRENETGRKNPVRLPQHGTNIEPNPLIYQFFPALCLESTTLLRHSAAKL